MPTIGAPDCLQLPTALAETEGEYISIEVCEDEEVFIPTQHEIEITPFMLQDNINQPVSQNQTVSGIAAEEMSKEQKDNIIDFATMLQNEASSYLPGVYEASAGCVESHRGVVVKIQIFHGNQPLVGGDILIQKADKEQEEWRKQAEEFTIQLLAQSINELLQSDNNAAPKGS